MNYHDCLLHFLKKKRKTKKSQTQIMIRCKSSIINYKEYGFSVKLLQRFIKYLKSTFDE